MKPAPLVVAILAWSSLAVAQPAPKTLDEFKAGVQKVLAETGVPGAGIALVRQSGVEWAGGIGYADRDRKLPVTADTHFRAGSTSKTFIAIALVQLSEDGDIDLDAPVATIAPKVEITNPWDDTDPVRVIHLLQHTAGFDDMHFNEMYNLSDPADMDLEEVLRINPSSRIVRWRPGTRMSYSNPGYTVAAYVLEQVTKKHFEDVIAEKIFAPIGMPTSSFRLTKADEALLAKGYRDRTGPPVGYSQIYLRPSGNLHTSPAEFGKFVQVLLNWGEKDEDTLVVDPEYLSNMEHPRTTLASRASLRSGYGSGIQAYSTEPFPLLGHDGGIDGFVSRYAYSTSRDVGFVVMLNATFSRDALNRISDLAIRYLKADVEPPAKPRVAVPAATLQRYEGYYQDAAPRLQAVAFLQWLLMGQSISVDGDHLSMRSALGGRPIPLIPVGDNQFRGEHEVEATRIFTTDEAGVMVMTGAGYAERVPRWQVEIVRWPVLFSAAFVLTPFLAVLIWLLRIRHRPGFWALKISLLFCAIGFGLPVLAISNIQASTVGLVNVVTVSMFAGTLIFPVATALAIGFTIHAWLNDAGWALRAYALLTSLTSAIVLAYVTWWGVIGFKPWDF